MPSAPVNGTYYVGFATSHEGDDVLCVVPAEAYVPRPGTDVTLNVTVKFKHAQPCPYSDWEILVENPDNVRVVDETETELTDPYTAFKQYTVEVLGNGSLDVVFKYGSGCPYGTEERVTIRFYVGVPEGNVTSNQSAPTPEEVLNMTEVNVTGTVTAVDEVSRVVVVDNYTIEIRGKWTGPDGLTYNWREMLALLKPGESVEILASEEEGSLKADVIIIDGKRFTRG
uniref:Uncharacterized protein n=1 Tax=Thermococcus aciditolerans TaxID=2598455 RepID=A0A5C0SN98_9EURY|nr:hypothetical protein FPV09_05445 [Thermococcus aciditolerans]